jgi:MacB-like protein
VAGVLTHLRDVLRTRFKGPAIMGLVILSVYSSPASADPGNAGSDTSELFGINVRRNVVVSVDDRSSVVVGGAVADGRYFSALRVRMTLGRPITVFDDRPGAAPVAVISHRFWRQTLASDPAVVGRSVRVNGVRVEIVGVSAEGFTGLTKGNFLEEPDITLPLTSVPLVWPGRQPRREKPY